MKFTADTRAKLVDATAGGLSLPEASKAADVRLATVKKWINRGRREDSGDYAEFVAAVELAREGVVAAEAPMDESELFVVVSRSARKGSVQAMKLYWEMVRADSDEDTETEKPSPLGGVDELAARRAA